MKAVNLIPTDAGRGSGATAGPRVPAIAILGVLGVAVAFVTIYVLTTNTISERQAKVGVLQAQAARANAQAASLNKYTQFEQLAQTRAQTVREIASTRFNWHTALADLSKVVPASTSLQSLIGSVAPERASATQGGVGRRGPVDAAGRHLRTRVRAHGLQQHAGRRCPADVAAAADQWRDARDARRLPEARRRGVDDQLDKHGGRLWRERACVRSRRLLPRSLARAASASVSVAPRARAGATQAAPRGWPTGDDGYDANQPTTGATR